MHTAWCFPLIWVCSQWFSETGSWCRSELAALCRVCSCVTAYRDARWGDWGAAGFSTLGWGFLRLTTPPVCFAPALSSPACRAGGCLVLLVETLPCRCCRTLLFALPPCLRTRGSPALFQLHAAATAATPEQSFCSERQNSPVLPRDWARCPGHWLGPWA